MKRIPNSTRTDNFAQVVEPWSASIGDPGRERTETIDADHREMCRFSGKTDPGYVKVGSEIASRVNAIKDEYLSTKSMKQIHLFSLLISVLQKSCQQPKTVSDARKPNRICLTFLS